MSLFEENKVIILNHEQRLAALIANKVIEKPQLSFWMILIPIIFVHYFQKLNKVANGRKEFVANYLVIRQRALVEAYDSLGRGRKPDLREICRQIDLPEKIKPLYGEWLMALVDYYMELLKGEGDNFEALARSAHDSKEKFLLTINHLCDMEKRFNDALSFAIVGEVPESKEFAESMNIHSRNLRMEMARDIFGG